MVAPARIARHPMCTDDIVSVDPLYPRAGGLGDSENPCSGSFTRLDQFV
jgi:hypothetical protein